MSLLVDVVQVSVSYPQQSVMEQFVLLLFIESLIHYV